MNVRIVEKLPSFSEDHPYLIGTITVIVFLVLALFIPFTGIIGGFFQTTVTTPLPGSGEYTRETDYFWDGVGDTHGSFAHYIRINYEKLDDGSLTGRLWLLCHIWGYIFILFPLLGSGLIIYYIVAGRTDREPNPFIINLGFRFGMLATIGEWIILFITFLLEDWTSLPRIARRAGVPAIMPSLNVTLFSLSVIGWIVFIYGYKTISNPKIKQRYKPSEAKYVYHKYT